MMPSRRRRHLIRNLGRAVVPAFIGAALLAGGASAGGYAANLLLQLAAIALIYASLLVHPQSSLPRPGRQLLVLLCLLLALFAIQVVPLPVGMWAALPGRQPVQQGFALLGSPAPWLPLSMTPRNTLASLFWLLPAFAVLLGALRLGAFRARWVGWVVIAVALASVALGAVQLAGGMQSPAYLYRSTNYGVAVGFFANANHLGTLLLVTIPFLAALLGESVETQRDRRRASALAIALAGAAVVILIGLAITGSLAAIGLAVPTAAASVLIARRSGRGGTPRWALPAVLALGLIALGVVMSQPFGNNLTGKGAESQYSRRTSYEVTLAATTHYLPVGSGIGSFVDIYRQQEDPAKVTTTYMNHAHSDLLEIVLETGIPGIVLLALFLLWWGTRAVAVWRAAEVDRLAQAAVVASAAVMAHSLVDYPLRTAAIASLFAFCLAMMAGARERVSGERRTDQGARHLSA